MFSVHVLASRKRIVAILLDLNSQLDMKAKERHARIARVKTGRGKEREGGGGWSFVKLK